MNNIKEEFIYFQMDKFLHREKVLNFLSAYINGKEMHEIEAIAYNTALLLDKMYHIVTEKK